MTFTAQSLIANLTRTHGAEVDQTVENIQRRLVSAIEEGKFFVAVDVTSCNKFVQHAVSAKLTQLGFKVRYSGYNEVVTMVVDLPLDTI